MRSLRFLFWASMFVLSPYIGKSRAGEVENRFEPPSPELQFIQQVTSLSGPVYDFFLFVQQWPGSMSPRCYPTHKKPPVGFGIHGLWPQKTPPLPQDCDPKNPLNLTKIKALVGDLQSYWPSWECPASDSTRFWKYEWIKHGTCSEKVLDQYKYFDAAIKLKKKIDLLPCLKVAGILPNGSSYELIKVNAAIKGCIGQTPYNIQCRGSQLWQVSICVDYLGTKPSACPVPAKKSSCPTKLSFPKF